MRPCNTLTLDSDQHRALSWCEACTKGRVYVWEVFQDLQQAAALQVPRLVFCRAAIQDVLQPFLVLALTDQGLAHDGNHSVHPADSVHWVPH